MKEIYVNDPFYQRIKIPDYLVPILDTDEIQRLRSIKQMGLAYLTFPSAIHTRFEHSLGTCFLANMMCEKLGLSEQEKQLVVLSALLHDVAHVPFEHVVQRYRLFDIIKAKEQRLRNIFWESDLGDLIKRTGLQTEEVFSLVVGTHPNAVLNEIIIGPLSADRLDCLLRDSFYTNQPFSISPLTVYNIVNSFSIVKERHRRFVCIKEEGIRYVETLLFARQMLLRYVYESRSIRSAYRMLGRALGAALASELIEPNQILSIGDDQLLGLLSQSSGAIIHRLMTGLTTRKLYQTLLELDFREINTLTRVRLSAMNSVELADLEDRVARIVRLGSGDVLIDMPWLLSASVTAEISGAAEMNVLIIGPEGIYSLQERSELANIATSKFASPYLLVFGAKEIGVSVTKSIRELFSKPPYLY